MGRWHVPYIWKDQPVLEFNDRLDELVKLLPRFDVRGFGGNQFYNQVVRLPLPDDPAEVPVGIVSNHYQLIQHQQVVKWVRAALQTAGVAEDMAQGTLYISTYGERMKLWITLHGLEFDPGDGHPLRTIISCQNSVEGSCALSIKVMQVRWVCENGMIGGPSGELRKLHLGKELEEKVTVNQLKSLIHALAAEHAVYTDWLKTALSAGQLEAWCDGPVAETWGKTDAARTASICRSGYDGSVRPVHGQPPSRWQVGWETIVPGANAPVENAYHAAQALSWVASRARDLDVRDKRLGDIHELVDKLIGG